MSQKLKSLYKEEDKNFLERCVKVTHDGMKHLNHWNYERTIFFNKFLPKNSICAEIGVQCGKNAYRIYDVCKPSKLYLIDPWNRVQENKKQTQNIVLKDQDENEKCCRMFFDKKMMLLFSKSGL